MNIITVILINGQHHSYIMEKARRRPGIEKTVHEINGKDFRVRILGTVVNRDEANNSCIIDDGTGRVTAFFEDPEKFSLIETGKRLRIIGRTRENNEIDVEIIQDMSMIDMGLVEQTKYVLEKLR